MLMKIADAGAPTVLISDEIDTVAGGINSSIPPGGWPCLPAPTLPHSHDPSAPPGGATP
jgi:hypothetical protein